VNANEIVLPTRTIDPALQSRLASLSPGQRIRIVQTVRVGSRTWATTVEGKFRHIDYLATGLSTQRIPADDIVVPCVHFTKDNGELSSVSLDEHTMLELA
jgi:hypothetical protein